MYVTLNVDVQKNEEEEEKEEPMLKYLSNYSRLCKYAFRNVLEERRTAR